MDRKKVIAESTYFYGNSKESPMTFRIQLRFCEPIDEAVLRRALEQAIKRYPYYMVHCVSDGREYWLEPNHRPFELYHTSEPPVLGSDGVNGYLWAVSYQEDTLWLNFFHGLGDGAAAMQVLRTLTYYYCKERYDESLSPEGVRIGEDIHPSEIENPYTDMMRKMAEEQKTTPSEKGKEAESKAASPMRPFNLFEDSRLNVTAPVNHRMKIREQDMMQYCRQQDGTPGVVIALLLARAIEEVNPGNSKPIVTAIAVNLRPALEKPDYMGSPIGAAYLSYDGKIKDKEFTTQATGYRGRLILASDPDYLRIGIKNSCGLYAMIDSLPKLSMKKDITHKVIDSMLGMASYAVSYMGPSKIGAAEQYVKEIRLLNEAGHNAIMVEIMFASGYFYLDVVQQWQEELYFDAFCRQLSQQGISYELGGTEEHKVPGIELP